MNGQRTEGLEGPGADPDRGLGVVRRHLAAGRYRAALAAAAAHAAARGETPEILRLRGKALDGLGDYDGACAVARRAAALRPRNVRARLRLVRALWRAGAVDEALAEAERIAATASRRAGALLRVAGFFEEIGEHETAYRCRVRALQLRPEDPAALAAAGDSAAALGRHAEAERHYDRALYHDPDQLQLLERRARLRRRGVTDHRAAQIGYVLDRLDRDDARRAPVCYALAQELEDLGHHEPAFDIWAEGARCRLLGMAAPADADRAVLETVLDTFDEAWLREAGGPAAARSGTPPVFVTGMPCSGLERLGRLLAAAPGAVVLPEQGFFVDAVTRLASPADARRARFEAAARIPPRVLAEAYTRALAQRAPARARPIDRATAHWPLIGLIRRAFPGARIVHLRRDPLDHCLALFTTLFPRGHAWSYDLEALAMHYSTYHRVMGHWRRHLPGGLLDVDYERLVERPGEVAGQLAAFLGIEPFEPPAPPEAAALRGPGIGRWRAYAAALEPLARRLRADGVPVG